MNPGAHLSTGSLQGVGDFGLWALEGGRVIEFVASYTSKYMARQQQQSSTIILRSTCVMIACFPSTEHKF